MVLLIDPVHVTLCKVPEPSFETLKAVLAIAVEAFKVETEAEMCRWEDDGGTPYPETKKAPPKRGQSRLHRRR